MTTFNTNQVAAILVERRWAHPSDFQLNTPAAAYARAVTAENYRQARAAREVAKARLWDALLANVHSHAEAAVLHLHAPAFSMYGGDGICEGCDLDGYEVEPPPWPCSTLRVMAEAYRLEALYAQATT